MLKFVPSAFPIDRIDYVIAMVSLLLFILDSFRFLFQLQKINSQTILSRAIPL